MSVDCFPDALDLPRVAVLVDGDSVEIALTYGNGSSDPVLMVSVQLDGTRLGEAIASGYWWLQDRRWPSGDADA